MGALFQVVAADGRKTPAQIKQIFEHLVRTAPVLTSPYDGTWGLVDSIDVSESLFESVATGASFIADHATKWENAVAVKVKGYAGEHGKARKDRKGYVWLLGAWLAC